MDKNKNDTNHTQVDVVSGDEAEVTSLSTEIVGQVMTPADFSALDAVIQQLGAKNASLTEEEKKSTTAIVTQWNEQVIDRITQNVTAAKRMLAFLQGKDQHSVDVDENIELLNDAIGEIPEYVAYKEACEKLEEVSADAPVMEAVTDDMTITEVDDLKYRNQKASAMHTRAVNVATTAYRRAVKAYITAVNAMPEVQDAKAKLSAYKRKASKMKTECEDKATRAKINIAIADSDVRGILFDMMDFAKKI